MSRPTARIVRITKWAANYHDPRSMGSRLRAARLRPLLEMIADCHARYGSVSILDVGGTRAYWNAIPDRVLNDHRVKVTLANLEPSMDDEDERFRTATADGCDLSGFRAGEFHIAHSNSVIEHVGERDRVRRFASQIRRVAQRYFVQTPNFWFPIEPHFMTPGFQWLPVSARARLLSRFNLGHYARTQDLQDATRKVSSIRLLDARAMRALFPDAEIRLEWFLGLPKSVIAVKAR